MKLNSISKLKLIYDFAKSNIQFAKLKTQFAKCKMRFAKSHMQFAKLDSQFAKSNIQFGVMNSKLKFVINFRIQISDWNQILNSKLENKLIYQILNVNSNWMLTSKLPFESDIGSEMQIHIGCPSLIVDFCWSILKLINAKLNRCWITVEMLDAN